MGELSRLKAAMSVETQYNCNKRDVNPYGELTVSQQSNNEYTLF